MKQINELNEAVKKVIEVANSINENTNAEIWNKAPLIIHQRFCHELVNVAKDNPNKTADEVPKMLDILTAIRLLEEYYTELKSV